VPDSPGADEDEEQNGGEGDGGRMNLLAMPMFFLSALR